MKEINDVLLTIGEIVSMVLRVMAGHNFIPEERREQIEKDKMTIDKDLEKYFNYKE